MTSEHEQTFVICDRCGGCLIISDAQYVSGKVDGCEWLCNECYAENALDLEWMLPLPDGDEIWGVDWDIESSQIDDGASEAQFNQ